MSAPTITAEQVKSEYGWSSAAITVLSYNFFIVKSSEQDPVGHLMLHPAEEPLGRVSIEGDRVALENSVYKKELKIDSPALDAAGCVDLNKLHELFPGKHVEFRSDSEWRSVVVPRDPVRAFKCAVSGKLFTDASRLFPVDIMDPGNPQAQPQRIYVSEQELPR